jgi:hypothetical protein
VFRTALDAVSHGGTLKAAVLTAAAQHSCSVSTVKEIYFWYKPLFDAEALAPAEFFACLGQLLARLRAACADESTQKALLK